MGMSSAMIYGVLPVFLVVVVGASTASVGFIEGFAEATNSFVKILSGVMSDRIRFRKPLVVLGYALSAVNKLLFPIAETASMVLLARVHAVTGQTFDETLPENDAEFEPPRSKSDALGARR